MIERREGNFRGQGSLELFFQTWTATGTTAHPKGTLVITHGIGEHSECYVKTAEHLAPLGWDICAWDLRGHGRSEGKRGFVEDFSFYSNDLSFFLKHLKKIGRLDQPFALIGHSMGGLVTLRHLIDRASDPATPQPGALALSSPLIAVAVEVPPVKDFAARLLNRFAPSFTMANEIKHDLLTRDPEWLKTFTTDPLRHDRISPSLYLGMLSNSEMIKQRAGQFKLPTVVQAAGKEKIVSLDAIREFYSNLGAANKKLIVYEDSYHEIFNDLDREQVFTALDEFLAPALGLRRS